MNKLQKIITTAVLFSVPILGYSLLGISNLRTPITERQITPITERQITPITSQIIPQNYKPRREITKLNPMTMDEITEGIREDIRTRCLVYGFGNERDNFLEILIDHKAPEAAAYHAGIGLRSALQVEQDRIYTEEQLKKERIRGK